VFVVCCVGSGLCDKLIIGIGESYRVCVFLILGGLESSKKEFLVTVAVSVTQNTCFSLHSASPLTCTSLHHPRANDGNVCVRVFVCVRVCVWCVRVALLRIKCSIILCIVM